ncbi:hypothetical protein D6745_04095 [Candidatus Woesearchaeota archaeon]|nr:MAG: hypothetical protein D6745_04095 [Candidatus Woesearchaeota archaeon]
MKRAIRQALAIIIILLMSNTAFALISVNHISGQDGVDGYRRMSDHTFINITTDSENIRILGDEFRFFNCTPIQGLSLYYCSMDIGPNNLPAGPKTPPYKLQKYEGDQPVGPVVEAGIKVDGVAPTVSINSINTNDRTLEIEAVVEDTISATGYGCSGTKEIVFHLGSVDKTVVINAWPGDCTHTITETIDAAEDGVLEFSYTARDNTGNERMESLGTVTVDSVSPSISGTLALMKNGNPVRYVSTSGSDRTISHVDAFVTITDANLQKVEADISGLNPQKPEYRSTSWEKGSPGRVSCEKTSGNNWECSWREIDLLLSSTTAEITVTAFDEFGHNTTRAVSATLIEDNDAPVVNSIETELYDNDGNFYLRRGQQNLKVVLTDTGAGFNNNLIWLMLNELNPSYTTARRVFRCEGAEPSWECTVPVNVNIQGPSTPFVSIVYPSRDDVGNAVTGETHYMLYFDDAAPIIDADSFSIINQDGLSEIKGGDVITITFNVTEPGWGIREARANLSELYSIGHENDVVDCAVASGELYTCTISPTDTVMGGHRTADLYFEVSDFSNNTANITIQKEVFGVLNETGQDLIGVDILEDEIRPKNGVSRLTLTLVDEYAYSVPFKLTGNPNVKVLNMELDDCSIGGDESIYEDYFFSENYPRLVRPRMNLSDENRADFALKPLRPEVPSDKFKFNVTCELRTYEMLGSNVYPEAEIDNFTFPVKLRGSRLNAPPDEKIKEKIKKAQESGMADWEWIGEANNALKKFEGFCNNARSVVHFWQAFSSLEALGSFIKHINEGAGEAVFQVGCYPYEFLGKYLIYPFWYGQYDYWKKSGAYDRCKEGSAPSQPPTFKLDKKTLSQASTYASLRNYCDYASCSYVVPWQRYIDMIGGDITAIPGLRDTGVIRGLQSYGYMSPTSLDPKNNLPAAVATACLPGIIYNMQKYRYIQCEYINCMRKAVSNGGDIGMCADARAMYMCTTVLGEAFDFLGFTRLIRGIQQSIISLPETGIPRLAKALLQSWFTCDSKGRAELSDWQKAACDMANTIRGIMDVNNKIGAVASVHQQLNFNLPSEMEDICEDAMCPEDKWNYATGECEE